MRTRYFFANRTFLFTAFIGVAVNVLLVFAPPLRFAFGLQSLNGAQWLAVALCSLSILPVGMIYTAIASHRPKKLVSKRRKHTLLCGNNE